MSEITTLFCPIAYDLAREDGKVVCGPGTKKACNHAIELARKTPGSAIFLCAGEAPHFDYVNMGKVMMNYISTQAPELVMRNRQARLFNTVGELIASAEYIGYADRIMDEHIVEMVYVVKKWHAERVAVLADIMFREVGFLHGVRHRIETHTADGRWQDKLLEPLKTFLSKRKLARLIRDL